MIKILFIINSLGGGGAEKVLVNLLNNIDRNIFEPTVLTLFSDGINKNMLNKEIQYSCKKAPCFRGITLFYKFIPARLLYKYFIKNDSYDILVAYMHGIPTKIVSGCNNKTIKRVTWLHFGDMKEGTFFDPWLIKKTAINQYSKLDAIVGVAESVTKAFSEYTGIRNKLFTLYNTNENENIIRLSNEPSNLTINEDSINIISVGRLSVQKGYDRLVNVMHRLHNNGYKVCLYILGQGEEESNLKKQINTLDANEYVKLFGFQNNPYSTMKKCDIFISSSRMEGLATVLTEAIILGLPVVATDVSGSKEVLGENNEYGLVVDNNEDAIYFGIKKMLDNKDLREHYQKASIERSKYFTCEATTKRTETFFQTLMRSI